VFDIALNNYYCMLGKIRPRSRAGSVSVFWSVSVFGFLSVFLKAVSVSIFWIIAMWIF